MENQYVVAFDNGGLTFRVVPESDLNYVDTEAEEYYWYHDRDASTKDLIFCVPARKFSSALKGLIF